MNRNFHYRTLRPGPLFSGIMLLAPIFLAAVIWRGDDAATIRSATETESPVQRRVMPPEPFVLLELFTSQGCSSCPPADRQLARLDKWAKTEGVELYALSFHVDYWNYLGWKDPYSDAAFSRRQYQYADWLRSRVYTPQLVVNGRAEMIGSRRTEVEAAVAAARERQPTIGLRGRLDPERSGEATVHYTLSDLPAGTRLEAALVEKRVHTAVGRGENRGRDLDHVQVVRSFTGEEPSELTGKVTLPLPEDLRDDPELWEIILFLQDTKAGEVLAAHRVGK